jgi:uncharacterized protein with beta-barrel porin domain
MTLEKEEVIFMSSRRLFVSAAILSQVLSAAVFANVSSAGPAYTVGYTDSTVYSVNLQTGANSTLVTMGANTPSSIAVLNKDTAYVVCQGSSLDDGNVYALNLQNGSYRSITPTSLPNPAGLYGIALANNNTAYVTEYLSSQIYSVDLQTGAYSTVATIPGAGLIDIAMLNTTTAYTVGYYSNGVYLVNLQTGAYSTVADLSSGNPGLQGIALANSTTAYVVGFNDGIVRVVNLQTGASTPVANTMEQYNVVNIGIHDTTAYTVGANSNEVYAINLLNGSTIILTTLPGGIGSVGCDGMALFLQMPTQGLGGNNRKFANYLNKNAPIDVIREFALLPDGLASALESAAPTRNAFMTFASQNAYMAASQVVCDHARQRRFHHQMVSGEAIAAEFPAEELLADASIAVRQSCKKPDRPRTCCKKNDPYTFWVTPFGEYAKEKSQQHTPGFNIGMGGVLAAFELNLEDENVVGFGAAYVYDHVKEDHGAGHANVNQGLLTVYSTLHADQWYFDLGLWGGYYHANNQRKISFPGVKATAKSDTHGWQLAPHFEVGYDGFNFPECGCKWFGIEPFLMADWVANWEKGFKEHGAGSLDMGQKGRFCSLLRGETGVRFDEIVRFDWGQMVFREKVSYAYQKAFHTGSITGFLVGSPGTFTVTTLTTAQNLGVGEFSMLFIFNNPNAPYIDLRYQGEFGSRYQSHQGMIEIGKDF